MRMEVMVEESYTLSSSSELRADESKAGRIAAWVFLLQHIINIDMISVKHCH